MKRLLGFTIFALLLSLTGAGTASATTYYIAATGSDSNNGTTKTTPWLHAPGMTSCTSTCSSTTPKAGDSFIFRGGDTWHFGNSSATPYVGAKGGWSWNWSGSSGKPIYIGVDQTWYANSSWVKPVLTGDNPMSTSFAGSCAYDFSNTYTLINLSVSYVTFDNFEINGVCWSSQIADNGMIDQDGGTTTQSTISNLYCHGWTMTKGASDNFPCIITLGGSGINDGNVYANDIFDGSDSPHFPANSSNCQWSGNTNVGCASGQGIYGNAWDVHNSVFRYLSNMMVNTNAHTIHDNLFEYLYPTFASGSIQQHPNVMNNLAGATGDPLYFYNNVMRNNFSTENIYFAVRTVIYFFNNVMYNNMHSTAGLIPGGCIRFNSVSNSSSTQTGYIYNNTFGDATCQIKFEVSNSPLTPWNGTGYFENNHVIGSTSLGGIYVCNTGSQCTIEDNGNEIYQTTAAATTQGYTAGNNYAPALATNATVVANGANLTASCGTFSADSELCSGTSGAVSESSGVATFPAIPMVPRPGSGAWNVGAYQFSSSVAGQPNPPTGLTAVVE